MISFVDSAGRAVRALMVAGVVAPSLLTAQASGDAARLQTQGGKSFSPTLSLAPATESVAGAPATISIEGGARRMLVGATVPHVARVRDAAGAEQREAAVRWT
jgi:hypothetical protein